MDLNSVAKLLSAISVHYPKFRQQISTEDGKIDRSVAEEWYKRIGYLDYEEADKRFEKYLRTSEAKYPPTISYFMNYTENKKPQFHYNGHIKYHVGKHGELLDEEDREYINPNDMLTPYTYNETGHIVQGGRLVQ